MAGERKYIVVREGFLESAGSDAVTVFSMIGGAYVGILMGSIVLQIMFPLFALAAIVSGIMRSTDAMTCDQAIEYIKETKGK